MRGVIFLTELLLFIFFFGYIFDYLNTPPKIREKGIERTVCDIAFVIESKREITTRDIGFMLSFLPENSYVEIISKRINYTRPGSFEELYVCKIEDTVVKVGI